MQAFSVGSYPKPPASVNKNITRGIAGNVWLLYRKVCKMFDPIGPGIETFQESGFILRSTYVSIFINCNSGEDVALECSAVIGDIKEWSEPHRGKIKTIQPFARCDPHGSIRSKFYVPDMIMGDRIGTIIVKESFKAIILYIEWK